MDCFCGCGQEAVQQHHVVYVQHLRRVSSEKGVKLRPLVGDARNLVPVAHVCHGRHHSAMVPFGLVLLPDSVFEFAAEVLGHGPAYEYLRRRYAGEDRRLEAMVCSESVPENVRAKVRLDAA